MTVHPVREKLQTKTKCRLHIVHSLLLSTVVERYFLRVRQSRNTEQLLLFFSMPSQPCRLCQGEVPAWTSFAEMSTPGDFPFVKFSDCTAALALHFLAKDGEVVLRICLGTVVQLQC